MKKIVFLLLACPLLLGNCIKESYPDKGTENYIGVGDAIPGFEIENGLTGDDRKIFDSSSFTGQKSILVFFITKCGDCERELPIVNKAWELLKDDGVQMVAVGRNEKADKVAEWWGEEGFTMPWYLDPQGRVFYEYFANQTVPRIYLIDERGEVVWMKVDRFYFETGEDMAAEIRKQLDI